MSLLVNPLTQMTSIDVHYVCLQMHTTSVAVLYSYYYKTLTDFPRVKFDFIFILFESEKKDFRTKFLFLKKVFLGIGSLIETVRRINGYKRAKKKVITVLTQIGNSHHFIQIYKYRYISIKASANVFLHKPSLNDCNIYLYDMMFCVNKKKILTLHLTTTFEVSYHQGTERNLDQLL